MRSSLSYDDLDNTKIESFQRMKTRKKYHSRSSNTSNFHWPEYSPRSIFFWKMPTIFSRFDDKSLSGISTDTITQDESFIIPMLSRGGGVTSWRPRRIPGLPISPTSCEFPILWNICPIVCDSRSKASRDNRYSLVYFAPMNPTPIIDVAIKIHTVAIRVSR